MLFFLFFFYCFFASAGSDLVDWLFTHVEGFADRRDARKYACNLLKANFIRHTVNKITFSEQCYYIFGDLCGGKSPSGIAGCNPSISEVGAPVSAHPSLLVETSS